MGDRDEMKKYMDWGLFGAMVKATMPELFKPEIDVKPMDDLLEE